MISKYTPTSSKCDYFCMCDAMLPCCAQTEEQSEVVINITEEMMTNDSNSETQIQKKPLTTRLWNAITSCGSFLSNASSSDPSEKKSDITCGGRVLRVGTAIASSVVSFILMKQPYSPFAHLMNMMSNKGWRSLTDLENITVSCKTTIDIAKKYIPLAVLIGGSAIVDKYLPGTLYFVGYTGAVLVIEDYNTWMAGGKKSKD